MVLGGEVTATDNFVQDATIDRAASPVTSLAAIDVVVRWGDWVLSVHELSPPRSFFVGEQNADVTLPAEIVGTNRVPVLLSRWDGNVRLVVPKGARILLGGQTKRMTAARAIARGLAQASTIAREGSEIVFLPGQTATLFFGPVALDFRSGEAAPRVSRKPLFEPRIVWAQMGSFVVHAVVLGILLFVIGPPEVDVNHGMTADQLYELQRRLWRLDEKEREVQWQLDAYERRARRNERRYLGSVAEQNAWMDYLGVASNRWSEELAAEARRSEDTSNTGDEVMGVLYDWPKPPPPPKQRLTIEEVMKWPATSPEERPKRARQRGPSLRTGAVSVSGRLPPEVIQRIVRQNFGRFRLCYENGLRNNPNLAGRVGVRFVIGRDGAVSQLGNGGSDMPDSGVVACVVRSFQSLSFPQPEAGIVTVLFPIMFSPGEWD